MNLNITLVIQLLVFVILGWVTMKFIWPPLIAAIEARQRKIADGLISAEKAEKSLAEAKASATDIIKEARVQANKIVDGKELDMGTLDCTWNGAKRTVTCAIPKGVFRFQVNGARMTGTLELTDGTLFRKIEVTR